MSTVYSLICWGGRTGKTVTLTIATPCVVSIANHGLRDGAEVVFSTTGVLPTGVDAGAPYYAKPTAAGTFKLYDTEANAIAGGATGRINTSGTQSGTHNAKGGYFLGLTSGGLSRYGAPGAERIYDGLKSVLVDRAANTTFFDEEVFEVGEAYSDFISNGTGVGIPLAPKVRITTTVNGIRSSGYHAGSTSKGYTWLVYGIGFYEGTELDGIRITPQTVGQNTNMVIVNAMGVVISRCIVVGTDSTKCLALVVQGAGNGCRITNNLFVGIGTGIQNYGATSSIFANNICTKCTIGIQSYGNALTSRFGHWYNNICVGNTTNWGVNPTSLQRATNNIGESGNPTWVVGSGVSYAMTTADFVDWDNNDLRPAMVTSPQVDIGYAYYGIDALDISDAERPNYNNGGSEAYDIGCYEFDHGFGPHPVTATLTLTGLASGTDVVVRSAGTSTILTSVDSTSGSWGYSYTTPHSVDIDVIKPGMVIVTLRSLSLTAASASIPISQQLDRNYS